MTELLIAAATVAAAAIAVRLAHLDMRTERRRAERLGDLLAEERCRTRHLEGRIEDLYDALEAEVAFHAAQARHPAGRLRLVEGGK